MNLILIIPFYLLGYFVYWALHYNFINTVGDMVANKAVYKTTGDLSSRVMRAYRPNKLMTFIYLPLFAFHLVVIGSIKARRLKRNKI